MFSIRTTVDGKLHPCAGSPGRVHGQGVGEVSARHRLLGLEAQLTLLAQHSVAHEVTRLLQVIQKHSAGTLKARRKKEQESEKKEEREERKREKEERGEREESRKREYVYQW